MIAPLKLAFSFLTRFPVGRGMEYGEDDYGNSFVFFPVVGLVLGICLALAAAAFTFIGVHEATIAFLLLVLLAVASGGLHLDGLADCADGFFSAKNREDSLRIMKEPCTGSFGAVSIVLVLIGKFAALWAILSIGHLSAIIPALVLSRWAMSVAAYDSGYPRESGTGKAFIGKLTLQSYLVSTAAAFAIALLFSGKDALILIAAAAAIALALKALSYRKIGGVTGDVLGAVNEVAELVLLSLH